MSLAFILVIIFGVLSLSLGQECRVPGECSAGFLTASEAGNYDECLFKCKQNTNCTWFSFKPFENFCQLFSECNNITEKHCKFCESGESACELTQCEISGLCQGQRLLTSKTRYNHLTGCLRHCQTAAGCNWYSFSKEFSQCLLFSECQNIDGNKKKFISGQSTCKVQGKILMATGQSAQRFAEIIDLHGHSQSLSNFGFNPIAGTRSRGRIEGAVGGLIQEDLPFICGGANTRNCYAIGQDGVSTTLIKKRYLAASAVIDNGQTLFVTGGITYSKSVTKSTELARPGKVSDPGPDLPIRVYSHCLLSVDENKLMLIGGYTGSYSQNVYFYHFGNQTWTAGPGLSIGRREHACGLFRNPKSQEQLTVAVVGGYNGDQLASVELFNLGTMIWEEGPDLPKGINKASMVSSPHMEGVMLLGGSDGSYLDTLYELQCTTRDCWWLLMNQRLAYSRTNAVAMYVPDIVQKHLVQVKNNDP